MSTLNVDAETVEPIADPGERMYAAFWHEAGLTGVIIPGWADCPPEEQANVRAVAARYDALTPKPAVAPGVTREAVATWRALDDNGWAEVLVNGRRITTAPGYGAANEIAERINRALSAPPQAGGQASADVYSPAVAQALAEPQARTSGEGG